MPADKITELVKQYCELMPSVPSRTLARVIFKDHPDTGSIDSLRSRIRSRRGTMGAKLRNSIRDIVESTATGYIPPAIHDKREPYVITQTGHILFVGDIHVPFHDKTAIELMLNYVTANYKIKAVCYMGDILDCIGISKFAKSARPPTMMDELEYAEDVMDTFQEAFPKAKHIWKDGNHEQRLPRYLYTNAPELHDIIDIGAGDLIGVQKRGMDYVGALQLIHAGKLTVVHGNEVGINSVGVNPARALYLKTRSTTMCFHLHNTSSHTDKDIHGRFPTCWSVGCMCDLSPDYAPYGNRFNLGFAVQELHKSGDFELENMRILNGKVVRG